MNFFIDSHIFIGQFKRRSIARSSWEGFWVIIPLEVIQMMQKVLSSMVIFQLLSTIAFAQTNKQIEIFDISKDKVIHKVQPNPDTHQEVKSILDGITGVYVKFNPIPNKGIMIRIPLDPSIVVKNQWFNDLVDEVTLIFPEQEDPYLLVFTDENSPLFFTFKGDTAKLLKLIHF